MSVIHREGKLFRKDPGIPVHVVCCGSNPFLHPKSAPLDALKAYNAMN